jgi:succinate dehydrogenase / fumarate reductase cytochrome b subunit
VESHAAVALAPAEQSVVARHQFLIKRLFSLSGLFFGGYVIVHVVTNASLLAGAATYQSSVDRIHALGPALPIIEWTFVFIPIIFHTLVGWAIILGATPNLGEYRYVGNVRYTLQRVMAIILFFFIVGHVLHMHHLGTAFGGGRFRPEHASSSTAEALRPLPIQLLYALGVLAAAFHLGNGIWTAGIAWGVWTTPAAQRRANAIAIAVGVFVALAGFGGLIGARSLDIEQAKIIEQRMDVIRRAMRGEVAADPVVEQSAQAADPPGGNP